MHWLLALAGLQDVGLHALITVVFAGFGRKEVVEYLLENGANVNAQDDGE